MQARGMFYGMHVFGLFCGMYVCMHALEQDVAADTAPSSNDDRMHVATDVLVTADTYSVMRSPRMLRFPSGSVEPLVVSPLPTQPQLAQNADFGLQEFPEEAPTLLEWARFQPPTCGAPHRAVEAVGDPPHLNDLRARGGGKNPGGHGSPTPLLQRRNDIH